MEIIGAQLKHASKTFNHSYIIQLLVNIREFKIMYEESKLRSLDFELTIISLKFGKIMINSKFEDWN